MERTFDRMTEERIVKIRDKSLAGRKEQQKAYKRMERQPSRGLDNGKGVKKNRQ